MSREQIRKLLKEKDIDGLTIEQFQSVLNKIIKPYIVKGHHGSCIILIPLPEWDEIATEIHSAIKNLRISMGLPG